jgi:hypothetical protein
MEKTWRIENIDVILGPFKIGERINNFRRFSNLHEIPLK